jgi:hypothetical protein
MRVDIQRDDDGDAEAVDLIEVQLATFSALVNIAHEQAGRMIKVGPPADPDAYAQVCEEIEGLLEFVHMSLPVVTMLVEEQAKAAHVCPACKELGLPFRHKPREMEH